MGRSDIHHSYPHCWRCHKPDHLPRHRAVVHRHGDADGGRLTAATTTFRQRALDEIKQVKWDPAWGEERISNMIATRPDWCISRQRIWGVPIAVFLCQKCHKPLNDPAIHRSIVELFAKEGADAWYIHEAADLLPAGTTCAGCGGTEFREGDGHPRRLVRIRRKLARGAGSRARTALARRPLHRGRRPASRLVPLLPADVGRGAAERRLTGWWPPPAGRSTSRGAPFSKSLGNGVDPVDIAKRLGGEIVRLWVASVDFREDVAASENLMQRVSRQLPQAAQHLPLPAGQPARLRSGDGRGRRSSSSSRWTSTSWRARAKLTEKVLRFYEEFEFHRVYTALNEFAIVDLSALYLDVLKDRIYTFAATNPARRSAQTVLWKITEALARLVAPILSFTAEEVWDALPPVEGREASVHLALFPKLDEIAPADNSKILADWAQILSVRNEALKILEEARKEKRIGKALEARVKLSVPEETASLLRAYEAALPEVLNVSQVEIASLPANETAVRAEVALANGDKCDRCWRFTHDVSAYGAWPHVCARCQSALSEMNIQPPAAEEVKA